MYYSMTVLARTSERTGGPGGVGLLPHSFTEATSYTVANDCLVRKRELGRIFTDKNP
jgi:hypothetical protein